ncbi:MAG: hypothetical protein Q8S03_13290 [Brevundimonas sp.]|uniref:hypothetical protein n=1 Tax=Brevundimonas sp. TaxID=1871086 RepID=UPI0027336FE3|nr:hypothetical protein [Brevundimonas sp.]MDP3405664.1 hypothetical protein [Brevundimonas sp.]
MAKAKDTPETQTDIAERAMDLKTRVDAPHHPAPGQTSNEGMTLKDGAGGAPSGAFDAEGQRPVLERSRKSR